MKLALPLASGLALVMTAGLAAAQVPAGYPADYAQTIEAAKKEGKVVVYGTTDAAAANFLVKDFEALYGIKVEYNDLNSTELYNRFIAEAAAGQGTADVRTRGPLHRVEVGQRPRQSHHTVPPAHRQGPEVECAVEVRRRPGFDASLGS